MPLYTLTCIDKPGSLDLRVATREAHLTYVRSLEGGLSLKLGGPFLDEQGQMAGSLLVLEAPDRAAAEAFSAADPYAKAGLFANVEIREFRVTIGEL